MKFDISMTPIVDGSSPDLARVFQACVEGSNDAIMLTDIRGVILYVNPAWERAYGYPRAEALGQTPRLLRSGQHDASFYAKMWVEILDPKKGSWHGEVINRAKDGREVPVHLTISPFRDDGGVIRGYMSIGVDIREKKELEAQVLRQDRLASIGLLASGLAHEIGTPLGVVRGRAEYLLADAPEGTPARRSLETIVSQIDRVSKLIYSLLNLARIGPSEITTPVSVAAILREVGELIHQKLHAGRIAFEICFGDEVVVKAEPGRLEQVFLNLCVNAVHAIEAAIQDGRATKHAIRASAKGVNDMWEISLDDTGCGISSENMNHLFKPFFTTKDVGCGTGLGLVITHQILQSWGGAIAVESREGTGTSFKVRLPKA